MARRSTKTTTPPPEEVVEQIHDVDVSAEMRSSFLEYAYSVIYQRALPDARDGLKPVQRRIMYQMGEMGLRSDRGHVKSARVVGEVMGKLHPHGDSAIYDALVRMSQPFAMRLPLVDGHGNFGSLGGDDAPAAMRYTECRPAPAATLMTTSIDENVVDFVANYDGQEQEPQVLPAAFPNLLVNGSSGIAVGMATNIPPHNLGEVIAAARHLIKHPEASLDDLLSFVPGPDLPTGGSIVGLDGVRDAYAGGRGSFKIRATANVENVTARRKGIVVTELPYGVGPERVVTRIKELVQQKKLQGISDLKDLTDRHQGLRLVIEIKNGFNPEAVLAELYRLTPMEETFGVNSVALVDGQPRSLGLKELLQVYIDHRMEVVRRRSEHRRAKREERVHLVDGLLVALLNIDEVIQVIRDSDDSAQARQRLMTTFDLSQVQANYILDTPLRRLTKYDRLELERERETLRREIAELTAILDSGKRLAKAVSDELAKVAKEYGNARRTTLTENSGEPAAAVPLEVSDDPCWVLLSVSGLVARTPGAERPQSASSRTKHGGLANAVATTTRGALAVITNHGRLVWLDALDLPVLPAAGEAASLADGVPVAELVELADGERVVGLTAPEADDAGLVLGTRRGVVKRVSPDYPPNKNEFEVIALREGDEVVGAVQPTTEEHDLVFITSDAQLLRFPVSGVRQQGRTAGGVAGIRLGEQAEVVWFGVVDPGRTAVVVTISASSTALAGTDVGGVKVTPYREYPAKGRATGGVRCHRFLKGEDQLVLAWAGPAPAQAASAAGKPVKLPEADGRRDGSGAALPSPVATIGAPIGH